MGELTRNFDLSEILPGATAAMSNLPDDDIRIHYHEELPRGAKIKVNENPVMKKEKTTKERLRRLYDVA